MIEQFMADGITYMFGNPGTVEQGFLDALEAYPDFKYILTMQESVAVLMADGYARATQKPGLVQLHTGVGLGNGVGALYQAMRGHAPLVVIASDAGVQYDAMDAQMAADLVSIARPVTKWSARVTDSRSLLRMLRRAIKIAMTPPTGPVFLALPMDVLDAEISEAVHPTSLPSTRTVPVDSELEPMLEGLLAAETPMIFMGDGIAFAGAQAELTKVAELLGAEVWGVNHSEVNIDFSHPLYQGSTGHMFGEHSKGIIQRGDGILVSGTYLFPDVFPSLEDVYAPGAKVSHIDLNAYEIAKNYPVDHAVVADPKGAFGRLAELLEARMTDEQRAAAKARVDTLAAAKKEAYEAQRAEDEACKDQVPLKAASFMLELAKQLPQGSVIFDEALTSSPPLTRYMPPQEPGTFFQTRGGSLGVGIPGALGAKLARPERTVFGFSGDGGSMYTIQALWTAAHHGIDTKFVICNNQSYLLLKLNIVQYWKERDIELHEFPKSFDLTGPVVDFAAIAESMGVKGVRVEKPEQIEPAIREALAHKGPFLIDLVLTDEVPGVAAPIKCGQ